MILVISDLHFEEEAKDTIPEGGGHPAVALKRNFSRKAFEKLKKILTATQEPGAPVDVVLAGDIFDLHRTSMWFNDAIRPYDDASTFAAGSPGEAKVLEILAAIGAEPAVKGSLEEIRLFGGGAGTTRVHYIPGNHDRLANATPAIRNAIRAMLGLPASPEPFPHAFLPAGDDPPILVRHGHEYDRFNFSVDHAKGPIPLALPAAEYDAPTFGDFITVEVASRLPLQFRNHYTEAAIRSDPVLRGLYLRLLEFDDVRPQSALVEFLLGTPGVQLNEKRIWKTLEPVVREMLDAIAGHPFLSRWLKKLEKQYQPDVIDLIQLILSTKLWKVGLPLSVVRKLAAGSRDAGAASSAALLSFVAREEAVTSGQVKAVIAGHTHNPQVALFDRTDVGNELYYVDTGTWRKRVTATPDETEFGRLKALTYVITYGKKEDLGDEPITGGKVWSFDYWSGFTQRW